MVNRYNTIYKEQMPKFVSSATPKTVKDAIGDLPIILPSKEVIKENGHK